MQLLGETGPCREMFIFSVYSRSWLDGPGPLGGAQNAALCTRCARANALFTSGWPGEKGVWFCPNDHISVAKKNWVEYFQFRNFQFPGKRKTIDIAKKKDLPKTNPSLKRHRSWKLMVSCEDDGFFSGLGFRPIFSGVNLIMTFPSRRLGLVTPKGSEFSRGIQDPILKKNGRKIQI